MDRWERRVCRVWIQHFVHVFFNKVSSFEERGKTFGQSFFFGKQGDAEFSSIIGTFVSFFLFLSSLFSFLHLFLLPALRFYRSTRRERERESTRIYFMPALWNLVSRKKERVYRIILWVRMFQVNSIPLIRASVIARYLKKCFRRE